MTEEPELGEIEWLDGDPPERPDAGRSGGVWRWYALGFAALAVVVLVVAVERRPSHRAAARATTASTPTSVPAAHPATTPFVTRPAPSPRAITVTNLGRPLLSVPRSWELYARDPDAVLRIQLATGRVVRTEMPAVLSNGPMAFLAGPRQVIVKAWQGGGVVIRDGRPARELYGVLAGFGPILPGPEPGQLWVSPPSGANDPQRMDLVGFDGRRSELISIPVSGVPTSDGAGYLLSYLTGGIYDARPGSLHRVTTGALLAIGPTRWLTEECDERHHCTMDVVDRSTDVHRVLGPGSDSDAPAGNIAPDGSTAAVLHGSEPLTLSMLDLATGIEHHTGVEIDRDDAYAGASMAWTPDGRWLIVADAQGHLVVVDHGGHSRVLTTRITRISQLTLRAG
ncbi:MAG TPA: hypothetical protein VGJ59_12300 [Jatrophihabitantaceae bacterium]